MSPDTRHGGEVGVDKYCLSGFLQALGFKHQEYYATNRPSKSSRLSQSFTATCSEIDKAQKAGLDVGQCLCLPL